MQCPAGAPATDTCANLPCSAAGYCGTVEAGPTQNVGPGQFVYLNFSGFAPGDSNIIVYYCADPGGAPLNAPGQPPPYCAYQDNAVPRRRRRP